MIMQDEINAKEWEKAGNWSGGVLGIYRSARDTRVIVPKRNPAMGWTLNLGNPAGVALGVATAGVVVGALLRTIRRRSA